MKHLASRLDEAFNPWNKINQIKDKYGALSLSGKAKELVRGIGKWVWKKVLEEVFEVKAPNDEMNKKIEQADVDVELLPNDDASPDSESAEDSFWVVKNGPNMKEFQEMMKNQLLPLLNSYRMTCEKNLPEMSLSEGLCSSARQSLDKNIRSAEWRDHHFHSAEIVKGSIGEITTSGFESVEQALENFISSPLHRWYMQRGYTQMGYAALQGDDGSWYLNIHLAGASRENAPENMKIGDKRELDESESEFLKGSKKTIDDYWEKNKFKEIDLSGVPDDIRVFLESNDMVNNRTKWMFSLLEGLREKKYPKVKMQLQEELTNKLNNGADKAWVVVEINKNKDEKRIFALNSARSFAVELSVEEIGTEGGKKYKPSTTGKHVALDLIFE